MWCSVGLELKHLAQRFGTNQVDKVPKSTKLIFLALALRQSEYWHISLGDKNVNEIQTHFFSNDPSIRSQTKVQPTSQKVHL